MAGVHQMMMGASVSRVNPSIRSSLGSHSAAAGTGLTVNLPTNVAGDLMLIYLFEWSLAAIVAPSVSGWSKVGGTGSSTGAAQEVLFWKFSTGGEATASAVRQSGSSSTALAIVIDGDTIFKNPDPAQSATFAIGLNPPAQGSLGLNNMWLAFCGDLNSPVGSPAGMTQVINYNPNANAVAVAASYKTFTESSYDPAPFTQPLTSGALSATYVVWGK
jgi:hypothetical protein